MFFKAKQKYIRMSSRKVRLIADAIRDLKPQQAIEQLMFMNKAAASPLEKTIKQAIDNAIKNSDSKAEDLEFKSIEVGEGPTYKRWRAVSRGRAHTILKRTAHITVILKTVEEDNHRESIKNRHLTQKNTKKTEKEKNIQGTTKIVTKKTSIKKK